MSHIFIYITVGDEVEAKKIARTIVEEGLAACANIILSMTSVYRWQGKIEESAETVLILKTRGRVNLHGS